MKELPPGWAWTTTGEITEVVGGGTPSTTDATNFAADGIPWITPADMSTHTGKLVFSGARFLSDKGLRASSARLLPSGTVLYSSRAPIGYVGVAANPLATNQGFKSFIPAEGILSNFLYYYLENARALIVGLASGTTFLELSGKKAAGVPIPVAPTPEQRRIVAEIDRQIANIDTTTSQLMAVRQKTATFAISVIRATTSAKPHWRIARTAEVCSFITKGTTPASHQLLAQGDVPFLKVNNLTFGGPLDFSRSRTFISKHVHDNELSRSKVCPGDVLMNIVGPPLGKVAIVPDTYPEYNINQAVARFRPVPGVDARYLALLLRNPEILAWALKRAKTTAGQVNLTLELCRDLPLPIAPETEQQQIAVAVDQALALSDNARLGIDTALARAARLRPPRSHPRRPRANARAPRPTQTRGPCLMSSPALYVTAHV